MSSVSVTFRLLKKHSLATEVKDSPDASVPVAVVAKPEDKIMAAKYKLFKQGGETPLQIHPNLGHLELFHSSLGTLYEQRLYYRGLLARKMSGGGDGASLGESADAIDSALDGAVGGKERKSLAFEVCAAVSCAACRSLAYGAALYAKRPSGEAVATVLVIRNGVSCRFD